MSQVVAVGEHLPVHWLAPARSIEAGSQFSGYRGLTDSTSCSKQDLQASKTCALRGHLHSRDAEQDDDYEDTCAEQYIAALEIGE